MTEWKNVAVGAIGVAYICMSLPQRDKRWAFRGPPNDAAPPGAPSQSSPPSSLPTASHPPPTLPRSPREEPSHAASFSRLRARSLSESDFASPREVKLRAINRSPEGMRPRAQPTVYESQEEPKKAGGETPPEQKTARLSRYCSADQHVKRKKMTTRLTSHSSADPHVGGKKKANGLTRHSSKDLEQELELRGIRRPHGSGSPVGQPAIEPGSPEPEPEPELEPDVFTLEGLEPESVGQPLVISQAIRCWL
jgi:hypothetical protein